MSLCYVKSVKWTPKFKLNIELISLTAEIWFGLGRADDSGQLQF